jgi:hypothetical protein
MILLCQERLTLSDIQQSSNTLGTYIWEKDCSNLMIEHGLVLLFRAQSNALKFIYKVRKFNIFSLQEDLIKEEELDIIPEEWI